MIRRETNGSFLLIGQDEHSRLSGKLVRHFGNAQFAVPLPYDPTINAIAMHDAGWTVNDNEPSLNAKGVPLHVFETPLPMALRAWRASADGAAEAGDYCQLLVSLHVLGLSAIPASRPHTPREIFELNRFQQHEIERQEKLRRRMGMRTDIPLRYGLADVGINEVEDQLAFNVRLLQAMDRISLALCCDMDGSAPPQLFERIDDLPPRPGALPVMMKMWRENETLVIDPWPFDVEELAFEVPGRKIPAMAYASEQQLREAYARGSTAMLKVALSRPGRG